MSAAGQVLPLELVPGLDAALTALETVLAEQRAVHARLLRRVLVVGQVLSRGGCELGGPSQVALVLNVSEATAEHLLVQAELLAMLPGGLEALDSGLFGVEQAGAFTRAVHDLPIDIVRAVWEQLRDRLIRDASCGGVLPPARLKALVTGWVIQADPDAAVDRRRQAQDQAAVDYRKRDDGLVDLFAIGLTGPNAQAVLTRIRARAARWGAGDERPAGRRRLEALVDLILGRDQLPVSERDEVPVFCHRPQAPDRSCLQDSTGDVCRGHSPHQDTDPTGEAPGAGSPTGSGSRPGSVFGSAVRHCGPACGCRLGQPTPCGIDVRILIPLGAALGRTGELAQLVGHGPLEPDLTAAVLANRPRLFPVWVDKDGTPVAAGTRPLTPDPDDPDGLRQALLELAALPPPARQPRHPHDHPPDPLPARPPGRSSDAPRPGLAEQVTGPHPTGEHPSDDQGAYRVCDSLRLLTILRAPLCEWPGCGHRAAGCDQDHDKAWPDGPTCACNIGPLCRRHHRVKQLLWIKKRLPGNIVAWTDPTGRTWRSPSQHQRPDPRNSLREKAPDSALDRLTLESDAAGLSLSPAELLEQLWLEEHPGQEPDLPDPLGPGQVLDDRPSVVRIRELSALHPDDPDRKASIWTTGPTAGTDPWRYDQPWGPDLDNPYNWD